MICNLCAKKCNVVRDELSAGGNCGMPTTLKIALYDVFYFEEPCITGKNGSGAIFFSGCSLNCVYCQNYDISTLKNGKDYSISEFIEIIKTLEEKGVCNINLVNPTHFAFEIVSALKIYKPKVPVVWNSHGYENIATINYVSDYVDIFLPDLKYFSFESAQRYSGVSDYFEVTTSAINEMRKLKSDTFSEEGIMQSGLIVRHLILPLHSDDSIKILNYLNENLKGTLVSLMAQYVPCGKSEEYPEINRVITKREYDKVKDIYLELNFNGFLQGRSSASKIYIPHFL